MAIEKAFEDRLKSWLESQGIYALGTEKQKMTVTPCGYWEKRWGGGKYVKSGLPDMHIVVNGISIDAELKAPKNKPSELQQQKLNQIDDAGCMAMVLYPKDFAAFQKLILYIKTNKHCDVDLVTMVGLQRGWRKR